MNSRTKALFRSSGVILTLVVAASATGCVVVKPVVGAGAAVAGAAVKTTTRATTATAGAVADAIVPDEKPAGENKRGGR